MSIQFQEIPANNLVPIFATEFDNTLAAKPGPMPWKSLLIGQAVEAIGGSTPEAEKKWRPKVDNTGKLVKVSSDDEADAMFGKGSQIALMARAFRKNAKYMELYCIALLDNAAETLSKAPDYSSSSTYAVGDVVKHENKPYVCSTEISTAEQWTAGHWTEIQSSASSKTLTLTGPASESGPLYLLIGGQAVTVTVIADDTAATIAANIAAKVNSLTNLPVTATVASNVVTLNAKCKGAAGNEISVFLNFNDGEKTPAGVGIAEFGDGVDRVFLAGGAGDAELGAGNVGNLIEGTWFKSVGIGKGDNTGTGNVVYIKDILDERWKAVVQKDGVLYYGVSGNKTAAVTAGESRNSQLILIPGLPHTPTPPCETATASMGAIAVIALNDPAVPLSNWPVKGIVAPKMEDRLGFDSNNDILRAGVAMLAAGDDGTVYLKRCVTTYKTNAMGASDTSYQQLEKVNTLSYLRYDWNNYLAGKYPHAKLADDGNEYGPGQVVMTPKLGKAEILIRYKFWMSKGLVQNYDEFKANVVVERDPDDSTALNFLIPADLIDQLLICKSKIQFK